MTPIKYEPFKSPHEFASTMYTMFAVYLSESAELFDFHHLQDTEDLRIICQETTEQEVGFPTSPALEKAIQDCALIENPWTRVSSLTPHGSWCGWATTRVRSIAHKVEIPNGSPFLPGGPLFKELAYGVVIDYYTVISADYIIEHGPDHWALMIKDHSSLDQDKFGNGKDYILKSEILGASAIFHNQMVHMRENDRMNRYDTTFRYPGGVLAATIVTFIIGKVRVVQATCDPSKEQPSLVFTLRALSDFKLSCYDKITAKKIVKWVLCPPNPPQALSMRSKKA
ncbi:hypothetical protein FQN57_001120 [Myotisia sp. PD_48]|nr:hypothetical protein FQN57_001120 [Myotisia sp. PD_48]